MRRATHDTSWVFSESGALVGLSLGYDFCAEHENGVRPLREALGVSGGLGVEGRTATRAAPLATLEPYEHLLPAKRGSRKAREKVPAALFTILAQDVAWERTRPLTERLKGLWLADPDHTPYDLDRYDLSAEWSEGGLRVHARGATQVTRLTELAERWLNGDLALGDPHAFGFLKRGGLSLIAPSRMTEAERDHVLRVDLDAQRLDQAADATGVRQALAAAGLRPYALSPAWTDASETQVRFFLNPQDQQRVNYGWFNVEELLAWAKGEPSPILKDAASLNAKLPGPKR